MTTNTIGNSRPFAACTVEIDRVERVDHRVGLVANRKIVEKLGDACERCVAAVLGLPDERPQLLQVFARLEESRAAHFVAVGRFTQNLVEQLRRRHPIDHGEPARHGGPDGLEDLAVFGVELARGELQRAVTHRAERVGVLGREQRDAGVRETDEARPQERDGPEVGGGTRQETQERNRVLHFVGFKKPQALVDIRREVRDRGP